MCHNKIDFSHRTSYNTPEGVNQLNTKFKLCKNDTKEEEFVCKIVQLLLPIVSAFLIKRNILSFF